METQKALQLANDIGQWLVDYAEKSGKNRFVVGVSGGIDSAVVSTLCARSNIPTTLVNIPIYAQREGDYLGRLHCHWLKKEFGLQHRVIDLTHIFDPFYETMTRMGYTSELGFANSKSRLRMMCLYQLAQSQNGLVVGTGNKIEDFGVGFFTKYGDGGVDISPIGDLTKTEVWQLGRVLGIHKEIIDAPPTDGLWDDGRTDQVQMGGLTYPELEYAMDLDESGVPEHVLNNNDQVLLSQYRKIRGPNLHKMLPIPVFKKGDRYV